MESGKYEKQDRNGGKSESKTRTEYREWMGSRKQAERRNRRQNRKQANRRRPNTAGGCAHRWNLKAHRTMQVLEDRIIGLLVNAKLPTECAQISHNPHLQSSVAFPVGEGGINTGLPAR